MDCLFCKIIAHEIPAKIIYRDEQVLAFDDINPQAPYHKVIIPLKHIATLNDAASNDEPLLGHLNRTASHLAKELKIDQDGYRLVINCNKNAGQTIFHIHAHLIGGRQLGWPPG